MPKPTKKEIYKAISETQLALQTVRECVARPAWKDTSDESGLSDAVLMLGEVEAGICEITELLEFRQTALLSP